MLLSLNDEVRECHQRSKKLRTKISDAIRSPAASKLVRCRTSLAATGQAASWSFSMRVAPRVSRPADSRKKAECCMFAAE
jgi:hypothetical protein